VGWVRQLFVSRSMSRLSLFSCLVFAAHFLCCFVADEAYFDCNDNNLTGSIPTELGNLTQMHDFKVAGNMLTGTIPSEIGKLTNLGKL
jgi:hypothetical protein